MISTLPTACATCPFARHIEGDRYACSAEVGLSTVRGHWQPSTDCISELETLEADRAAAQQPEPAPEPTYTAAIDALTYSSFVVTVQAYEQQRKPIPSVESLSLLYGDDAERYLALYQHEQAQRELNDFLEAQANEIAPFAA